MVKAFKSSGVAFMEGLAFLFYLFLKKRTGSFISRGLCFLAGFRYGADLRNKSFMSFESEDLGEHCSGIRRRLRGAGHQRKWEGVAWNYFLLFSLFLIPTLVDDLFFFFYFCTD